MKIAWSEIRFQPKKFFLVELLIILMMVMVIFLTGLTNGLGRAVSAQIENYGKVTYLLSDDAEGVISFSNLTDQSLKEVKSLDLKNKAGLSIQRSAIKENADAESKDITYFAIEDSSLLKPKLVEGTDLSGNKAEIILDASFKDKGIKKGDSIRDNGSEKVLKVVGFAPDAKYGHSSVGFISPKTFEAIRQVNMPSYKWRPQAYVTEDDKLAKSHLKDSLKAYNQKQIIEKIPGYQAEHMTLSMITWVLLIVSSAILGVFFYILTLQKLRQFGLLKAIGMSMTKIAAIQLSQISILAILGAVLALAITTLLTSILPASMPFFLSLDKIILVLISFLVIAVVCGALSLVKVRKVDPIEVIGGNGE
ncbi:ABC transporter permease [Streptococcus didelphis]|uniref:ABC transporter permease n=1 Tax=Streptococcus didelphis TaxID=102886 RepID=UPI000364A205|nr:ABC transporter permease [Streptococcus didelphis]WMB29406.1 ABC transporter permease [Streptococcus didelphis]